MNRTDATWAVGRATIGTAVKLAARLRVYGDGRVPRTGGLVVASNHFSWVDPPALGAASPRTLYYMAKIEAHRVPGLGQLMRTFGAFASDIGKLSRIVTLENISLASASKGGGLVLDALAKTFRYLDDEELAQQRRAAAAKKGPRK